VTNTEVWPIYGEYAPNWRRVILTRTHCNMHPKDWPDETNVFFRRLILEKFVWLTNLARGHPGRADVPQCNAVGDVDLQTKFVDG
jgi:hypothetical protein